MQSLNEMAQVSNQLAHEKGWWDKPRSKTAVILPIQSEIAEVVEEYRDHHELTEVWYEKSYSEEGVKFTTKGEKGDKPCGIPIELADFVIRVADYAAEMRYDLDLISKDQLPAVIEPCDFEEWLARMSWAISQAWNADGSGVFSEAFFVALSLRYAFLASSLNGIDLWAAIDEKTTYNRTRSHRHGNKRI